MRYHASTPRGYAKAVLRNARARFDMKGKLEIHHVVPRQFKQHDTLRRYRYDVEKPYNTILLASRRDGLRLKSDRNEHAGGHAAYNRWVGDMLSDPVIADSFSLFCLMICACHAGSRGTKRVPWK